MSRTLPTFFGPRKSRWVSFNTSMRFYALGQFRRKVDCTFAVRKTSRRQSLRFQQHGQCALSRVVPPRAVLCALYLPLFPANGVQEIVEQTSLLSFDVAGAAPPDEIDRCGVQGGARRQSHPARRALAARAQARCDAEGH